MPNNADVVTYFGSLPTDLIALAAVVVLLVALGLTKGKRHLLAFCLALYPAAFFTMAFPYYAAAEATGQGASYARLGVFALSLLVCTVLLLRYTSGGFPARGVWRFLECLALAVACTGLCAVLLMHTHALVGLYVPSPLLTSMYTDPLYFFLWLVAPFAALVAFVRA